VLEPIAAGLGPRPHHPVQCCRQQIPVTHVGSAGDERQRDATTVD
jgi:hypothetical protein